MIVPILFGAGFGYFGPKILVHLGWVGADRQKSIRVNLLVLLATLAGYLAVSIALNWHPVPGSYGGMPMASDEELDADFTKSGDTGSHYTRIAPHSSTENGTQKQFSDRLTSTVN